MLGPADVDRRDEPGPDAKEAISVATRVYRYDVGVVGQVLAREIAVEAAVEIAFGGAPFAVMMATPTHLEDFAIGFALTEGIINGIEEIRDVEVSLERETARIEVALTGDRLRAHLARKRAMTGRTGCGVCGIEDIEHLPVAPRVAATRAIAPAAIGAAVAALEAAQPLNARTHAVHAAAWCGPEGDIRALREDVGRHNALDKLIGALLRDRADPAEGFVLITSRCSFEMVAKTAAFGAATLVSVSAPTSLALTRAARAGVTLISVARADQALGFADGGVEIGRGAAA